MTNYKLKNGDNVVLKENIRVDGYWHDDTFNPFGSWDFAHALKGTVGVIVTARTPCVQRKNGELYFANVDVILSGVKFRVRPFHSQIKRVKKSCL